MEAMVREWLDRATVNPVTGVPPDAKVSVEARKVTTFGHLKPGQSEPDSGMEIWTITATLYFPEDSPTWEDPRDMGLAIAQVLDPLEESLASDPTMGTGQHGLRVEWRGTEGDEPVKRLNTPPDYPWAVDVHLAAHFFRPDS